MFSTAKSKKNNANARAWAKIMGHMWAIVALIIPNKAKHHGQVKDV
jgi:hypothetical protein